MLFGQQLCRRHERHLCAVFQGQQGREERNDCLSTPNVALEQTMHATRAAHVRDDLADHAYLGASERERERLPQLRREHTTIHKRSPTACIARELIGATVQQLYAQQFFEGQACTSFEMPPYRS